MSAWKQLGGYFFAAGFALLPTSALSQGKVTAAPDAQVESDVLKALAANPRLAGQTISSSTVYGTVTLSGSVPDENTRKLAESVVSRTTGVQKVVDELTLGGEAPPTVISGGADNGTNPLLQSDGTLAQAGQAPDSEQEPQGDQQPSSTRQQPSYPQQQPSYPQQQPSYPQQQPSYGDGRPPAEGMPDDGVSGHNRYDQNSGSSVDPYGAPNRLPSRRPIYGQPPTYPQPYAGNATPYGPQLGGQPVTIPGGALLRVRINQGLDSRRTQPGTVFDAVVLNDLVAGGMIAIPRGATVQGTVVDAQTAGALRGRGELNLQLTAFALSGRIYPIASDTWSNVGGDKTSRTVGSALGLGAVGAIIGGVAGGGAGAAIGAGVGGAAGIGASAASGGGQASVPAEAILTFHLTQPVALTTVSQAEVDRLRYGVPGSTQARRRSVQPAPYGYPVYSPYARGPYPYRYPYPYPY